MKLEFREYVEGSIISHIPLSLFEIDTPNSSEEGGQEWLERVSKLAANQARGIAKTLRTSEQLQSILELLEGSAKVCLGEMENEPPLHAPEDKFEAVYTALALTVNGRESIHLRLRPLRKAVKAVLSLSDMCMIWQHLNDIRSGLDTLKRYVPAVHSDLTLTVWTRDSRAIALDTGEANKLLRGDVVPQRNRRSEFVVPGFQGIFPDFLARMAEPIAANFGAHPWTPLFLMLLEEEQYQAPVGTFVRLVRLEEEWVAAMIRILKYTTVVNSQLLSQPESAQVAAIRLLLARYSSNLTQVSDDLTKAVKEKGHYSTLPRLPIALRVLNDQMQDAIALPKSANQYLVGKYVANMFAKNENVPADRGLLRLIREWGERWDDEAAGRQLISAFGSCPEPRQGAWLNENTFMGRQFEGEFAGVSMDRDKSPHPITKGACGDFDIVVIDKVKKEVRIVEMKRFAAEKKWRDLAIAYQKFWERDKPAFHQLLRKMQWVVHYLPMMNIYNLADSHSLWTVRGCIFVTAAPRLLWIAKHHLNAVCELASIAAGQFLRGEDDHLGMTIDSFAASNLKPHWLT